MCDSIFAFNTMYTLDASVSLWVALLHLQCFVFQGQIIHTLWRPFSWSSLILFASIFAPTWCFYKHISWGQYGKLSVRYVPHSGFRRISRWAGKVNLSEVLIRVYTLGSGWVSASAILRILASLVVVKTLVGGFNTHLPVDR